MLLLVAFLVEDLFAVRDDKRDEEERLFPPSPESTVQVTVPQQESG